MNPKVYFHLVGYTFGMAAFALIYWSVWRALVDRGRDVHLKALIPIHFFRYFGLTALLPAWLVSHIAIFFVLMAKPRA